MVATNDEPDTHTIIISRWLEDLCRTTGTPKEHVIQSNVFLLPSVKSFTQFNTVFEYLHQCHLILEGDQHVSIPDCFIRQDISEFLKTLDSSTIFNSEMCKVKTFYLFTIILMLKIYDFDEMKCIVEDLIIIMSTEFESVETEESRKRLNFKIEIHSIKNIYDETIREGKEGVLEKSFEIYNTENKNAINWLEVIKIKTLSLKQNREENKDNFFYFPKFFPFFENLIYSIPTWGAIMKNIFNSPNLNISSIDTSSSNSIPEFKYITKNTFDGIEPTRVDDFVRMHVKDIIGKMMLVVSDTHQHHKNGIYNIYT